MQKDKKKDDNYLVTGKKFEKWSSEYIWYLLSLIIILFFYSCISI